VKSVNEASFVDESGGEKELYGRYSVVDTTLPCFFLLKSPIASLVYSWGKLCRPAKEEVTPQQTL